MLRCGLDSRDYRVIAGVVLGALPGLLALSAEAAGQVVPSAGIRAAAEWEPATGALVRWPLGVPTAVLQEIASDDLLYVHVSSGQLSSATSSLTSQGVNMANVRFIVGNADTYWTRDWGPMASFTPAGQYRISDYRYVGSPRGPLACQVTSLNSSRVNDDSAPVSIATYLGMPHHPVNAFLVGGNYLHDGAGTAVSTCLLVQENITRGIDQSTLNATMASQLGVTRHLVLPNFETSGIQHIDCAAKLVDEETVLVKRVPSNHASFAPTNQIAQIFSTTLAPSGRPYRVIRIDCPYYAGSNPANYTNSLILNRKILMPAWGIPADAVAAQTFREAFPGYEVVQFPSNSWLSDDALHCRVRAIWDTGMLHLRVERLAEQVQPSASGYTIASNVRAYSGQTVLSSSLRWRVAEPGTPGSWNDAPLQPTGQQYRFESMIPAQPRGTRVEYYLAAADASGRAETMPRTAPLGTYAFTVINDGLTVSAVAPALVPPGSDSVSFDVTIIPGVDTLVAGSPTLFWRTVSGGAFLPTPLTFVSGTTWRATLPRVDCDDQLQCYVQAEGVADGVVRAPFDGPAAPWTVTIGTIGPVQLLAQSFEGGTLPAGWSATGLWSVSSPCETGAACEGSGRARFAQASTCTYNTGARVTGSITSPAIAIPALGPGRQATLSFCYTKQTENSVQYDLFRVLVNGQAADSLPDAANWTSRSVDLSSFSGQTVTIAFEFDSVDGQQNAFPGVRLDNVRMVADSVSCTDVACDRIDFNNDGIEQDPTDIEAFLSVYSGGACVPVGAACSDVDFNNDGIEQDPTDIEAFLSAYSGGVCL